MAYYLAPSLDVLREEIDARWPRRDRGSDGWIGDEKHARTESDHNPNARGAVTALDVDKDGIDPMAVIAAAIRHPSTNYVIYNRKIYSRNRGFKAVRYTGSNPHDKHLHVSVINTRAAEQDKRPWGIAASTGEDDMTPQELRSADIWTNPYPDAPKNPTITLDTALRNIGGDSRNAVAEAQAARQELAELRTEVKALAQRPTTPAPELDYARLARELLRAAAGQG